MVKSRRCAHCGGRITIERGQRYCSAECQIAAGSTQIKRSKKRGAA
jgi:hypothetical protein